MYNKHDDTVRCLCELVLCMYWYVRSIVHLANWFKHWSNGRGNWPNGWRACIILIKIMNSANILMHISRITWSSVCYAGIMVVPAACGGMFIGGYIVKRFNLKVRGILKLVIGLSVLVLASSFVFLVRCKNVDFAGVSVTYDHTKMTRYCC